MQRIFITDPDLSSGFITVRDEKARYLSTVLRCEKGDLIIINDNRGNSYSSAIVSVTKKEVTVEITGSLDAGSESSLHIILLQGLLKGDKMDLVVQKATELGVKEIIPVVTERSQVRETRKLVRWQKIAEEAARQSERNVVPAVHEAVDFHRLFDKHTVVSGPGILFRERSCGSLPEVIGKFSGSPRMSIFTGPEGGFSEREVEAASRNGFITASLGKRILRAETAAITAVSIVQYVLGDIGE
jgi:16S rRNA (uracil1498-N3)-methyltransferase